jgi:hypothetical protein
VNLSIVPTSGYVKTTVQIIGNISTQNGTYRIDFDTEEVGSGSADLHTVNHSIIIPERPEGDYEISLLDIDTGEQNTTLFTVKPSYVLRPDTPQHPIQLQENDTIEISVEITGGKTNYTYSARNIKVEPPPANMSYEAVGNISTSNLGSYNGSFIYPTQFSVGANTNFTGKYLVLWNETVIDEFFIGLTNSSEYHRGDLVNVRAVDYQPNSEVNITISFHGETVDLITVNVTGTLIEMNWLIPENSSIGNYTVDISPTPDSKEGASDNQDFEIPGFNASIYTQNLADTRISEIFVNVYDVNAKNYQNVTSDEDGLAEFVLERGVHVCEAFYREVRVGRKNFTISNVSVTVNISCQLYALNVKVVDPKNVRIPEVSVTLSYNYTTDLGGNKNRTGTDLRMTNILGTCQFSSLLPNITYVINGSRYGEVFNQYNNTFQGLSVEAHINVTLLCPLRTLYVNVTDANHNSIDTFMVTTKELMGGLHYEGNTTSGRVMLGCTFGRYTVEIYVAGLKLNETVIDLFQNQSLLVNCQYYGLTVDVRVVDFFGRPIPNLFVEMQREGLIPRIVQTKNDGVAIFTDVIGGSEMKVSVYLDDETQPSMQTTFFVDSTRTIEVKLSRYLFLGGMLIETSHLATALVIISAVILLIVIELFRRKRLKSHES